MPRSVVDDLPYMVVKVGKWWGLFRVPPLASSRPEGMTQPETISWHASEKDAEHAAAQLATYDPSGQFDRGYPGCGGGIKERETLASLDDALEDED